MAIQSSSFVSAAGPCPGSPNINCCLKRLFGHPNSSSPAGVCRAVAIVLAVVASFVLHSPPARAQGDCAPFWQPGGNVPGVDGTVRAIINMPNGDLIVGGNFRAAGNIPAKCIARWNGMQWSALGSGMDGGTEPSVRALAVLPNGDVIAGGLFETAGGVSARNIARWNGTAWSPLSTGVSVATNATPAVYALAALPNGEVVVGGIFRNAGGVAIASIARWNGANWISIGTVNPNSSVTAIVVLPNGDLIATGAGSGGNIARWNGVQWSNLGSGMNGSVVSLVLLPNGDVIAAGSFTTAGGIPANSLARWNGTAWSTFGDGLVAPFFTRLSVTALAVATNGDVLAGGNFITAGGVATDRVARWNGTEWSAIRPGGSGGSVPITEKTVYALTVTPGGEFFAGGDFLQLEGVRSLGVSRWDSNTWSELGEVGPTPNLGMNGNVRALLNLPNGDLVTGGAFTRAGAVDANSIARWDGTAWSAFGDGTNGVVNALALLPNGDLVAAGVFTTAGGTPANSVARWDGTVWSAFGAGIIGVVKALAVMPNGDLIAAGSVDIAVPFPSLYIARWSGTGWVSLEPGRLSGSINALAVLRGGILVAGSSFIQSSVRSSIRQWDGATWSNLGEYITGPVTLLTVLPNGDLIAGGAIVTTPSFNVIGLGRWNGAVWSGVGGAPGGPSPNSVFSAAPLPNGDFVVSGNFSLMNSSTVNGVVRGTPANRIARWNGGVWTALGIGLNAGGLAIVVAPNGELVVGGDFLTAGGQFSPYISRYNFGCPPCSLADVAGEAGPNPDSVVDGIDFIAFINSFSTDSRVLNPIADIVGAGIDGDRPDGIIDGSDFIAFINAFVAGC